MFQLDQEILRKQLAELENEHRELDARITFLAADPNFDQLELRRMKKRKLAIKDALTRVRSLLIPDQPA